MVGAFDDANSDVLEDVALSALHWKCDVELEGLAAAPLRGPLQVHVLPLGRRACVERHSHTTRRRSGSLVDGVTVLESQIDAIFPKLKFRKLRKQTLSRHPSCP